MSLRIYCEPGGLSSRLRQLQHEGVIKLIHFAFDPGSLTHKISHEASPAGARWVDLGYTWGQLKELGITWADLDTKGRLAEIEAIIGSTNRRDVLHVNSAVLSDCVAFITRDGNILDHRGDLEELLGIRFFHPDRDEDALNAFVISTGAA